MNLNNEIGWCTATWNPVTGCLHGPDVCACSAECFARGFTHRFCGDVSANYDYAIEKGIYSSIMSRNAFGSVMHILSGPVYRTTKIGKTMQVECPFDFAPTLHRYRLGEPAARKKPENVFTVDMGDLFGEGMPDSCIWEVADACAAAPWHNYLFLTKNPGRYYSVTPRGILGSKITLLMGDAANHIWMGASATDQGAANKNILYLDEVSYFANTFMSVEPLMGPITLNGKFTSLGWVIIGAMSGPGAAAHRPRREWVEAIVGQCRAAGVPVYLKENLREVWGEDLIQQFPAGLREVAEARRK